MKNVAKFLLPTLLFAAALSTSGCAIVGAAIGGAIDDAIWGHHYDHELVIVQDEDCDDGHHDHGHHHHH